MKRSYYIGVFLYLSFFSLLHAEGFGAGTLVATQYGALPVETIVVGASLCNEHFICCATTIDVDSYVKIEGKDFSLDVTCDQKLYEKDRGWIDAHELYPGDNLVCFDGHCVQISRVEVIIAPKRLYLFSVETNHLYFVTPHGIIAHNVEIVSGGIALATLSFACPPAAIGFAVVQAITAGIITAGAYSLYKKNKKQKKLKKESVEEKKTVSSASSGGGKDPKKGKENEENKHPHGMYHDVSYHTPYGNSIKGPRPKNGQASLDNSVSLGRHSTGRVGISEGEIVVLRQTSEGLYHGYVETWSSLLVRGSGNQAIRNALTRNKLVTQSGKIINPMITLIG